MVTGRHNLGEYQLGDGSGCGANAVCHVGVVAVSLPCPPLSVPLPFSNGHRSSSSLLCCWEHVQLLQGWILVVWHSPVSVHLL